MNFGSITNILNIKSKFIEYFKSYVCCLECSRMFSKNNSKLNYLPQDKLSNTENDKIFHIELVVKKNSKNTIQSNKKKWLNYHYEILEKCLILFKEDVGKIKIFLNEFSHEEILKKINHLKNYNMKKKSRNQSISTYFNSINNDLIKNINLDLENEVEEKNIIKNKEFDSFSVDDFMNKNELYDQKIPSNNDFNYSLDSNMTQNFYETKNYNKIFEEENINTELENIFENNYKDLY